jgi:hypothetical protein
MEMETETHWHAQESNDERKEARSEKEESLSDRCPKRVWGYE